MSEFCLAVPKNSQNKFICKCIQSSGNGQENFEWRSDWSGSFKNKSSTFETDPLLKSLYLLVVFFYLLLGFGFSLVFGILQFFNSVSAHLFDCILLQNNIQCRTEGITWTAIKYSCTNNNYCAFFWPDQFSAVQVHVSLIIELMMTNWLDSLLIIFFLNGW